MQYYFSFDVESVGLYGPPFAYGWCLVDETGQEHAYNLLWHRHPYLNFFDGIESDVNAFTSYALTKHDVAWARDNVLSCLPEENRALTQFDLFHRFWSDWADSKAEFGSVTMVTDCPFPVETKFLHKVVEGTIYNDRVDKLMEQSPYPIIDVASVLLAHGSDPLATHERKTNELPAHNPLCDARQSVRLMLETMVSDQT